MIDLRLWKLLGVVALSAGIAGCGGGAKETPTVKLKPAEDQTAATNGGESGGQTKTNGEPAPSGGVGTIRGRVLVTGNLAELPLIVKKGEEIKDKEVCAAMDIPNESLVGSGGGVGNVFIYLAKAPAGASPASPGDADLKFDNKQCRFVPHAMFVQTGQKLMVSNSDPIAHNTHTFPTRNDSFNSLIKAGDTTGVPLVYSRPEAQPVQVKCDFHAWMIAYHLALDHPYAAVTAEDGSFEIKDLPAGKHSFRVWHERAGQLERGKEITVKPGDNDPIEIKFDAARFARYEGPRPKQVLLSLQDR